MSRPLLVALLLFSSTALAAPAEAPAVVSGPGGAPRVLRHLHAGPYPGSPEAAALAWLDAARVHLGLEGMDLVVERELAWRGLHRVHLRQRHMGLPVLAGEVVVTVDAAGYVRGVASHPARSQGAGAPLQVSRDRALEIAAAQVEGAWRGPARAEAWWLPARQAAAWRVEITTDHPLATWRVTVDGRDGSVLGVADLRRPAWGRVYGQNPVVSDLEEVELEGLEEGATTLDGAGVEVQSVVFEGGSAGYAPLAAADPQGDFLFDPDEGNPADPFAEVNAYHHVTAIRAWFEEVHGHTFARGASVIVNYREEEEGTYDNAFFTRDFNGGYLIATGQGIVDLAYDGDVLQHEFGHGIVDDLTDVNAGLDYPFGFDQYGFHVAPHALNEGMADYWASTFSGDPCAAEYFGSAFGADCLRNLENDLTTPEDVYGEPHQDGMIVGAGAWDLREALGAEVADDLLYGALGALTTTPSFQDLGLAVLDAAAWRVEEGTLDAAALQTIEDLLGARGWLRSGRAVALQDGVPEEGILLGADMAAGYLGASACEMGRAFGILFPLPFQYAYTVPEVEGTIKGLDITLALSQGSAAFEEDDLDYGIYLRSGEMVTFLEYNLRELIGFDYTILKGVVDYDVEVDDAPTAVRIEADDPALPLEPGTTIYLDVAGLNCPVTDYVLTATLDVEPVRRDDGGGDGCGCGAGPRVPGPWLLLAAPLLVRRRRDRR